MTKKNRYFTLTIVAVAILSGCFTWFRYQRYHIPQHYTSDIVSVLRAAGDNRKELLKVLKHYGKNPADSLKLRAAGFLIANMPGKYSEYYDAPWNDIATVRLRWTANSQNRRQILNTYRLGEPVREDDVRHITAEYLISNIELAFKVWREMPWGKHIPFDAFCEDILPYRVGTEPLENWREKVLVTFSDLYGSFREDSAVTAVDACNQVNSKLPRFRIDKDFPHMNFSQLMATTRSTCDGMSALAVFAMRGLGIPVTREFTPLWVGRPTGHSWNSVRDSSGIHVSFLGCESNPGNPHQGTTLLKAKVYRYVDAKQKNLPLDLVDIPPLLRQASSFIDVTSEYGKCADVRIPVPYSHFDKTGYAFLAIFQDGIWNPVSWGSIADGYIQFLSVGKNVIYLPVYYNNGVQSPASDPFLLDENGNCRTFKLDMEQMESLVLAAIIPSGNPMVTRMLRGRFEGANHSDFSDAKPLYTIETLHGPFYHSVNIYNTLRYRYIRYCSPDNGFCNVAELEFYDQKGDKLDGTVIGTLGSFQNGRMTRDKVFDGDANTFFDAEDVSNTWVGLDLGEPVAISKIRFLPRTDGNSIYEGHSYRLFYWNDEQWQLHEEKIATDSQIQFHVPSDAIFYLQNVTTGKVGIPFIMNAGKQEWF